MFLELFCFQLAEKEFNSLRSQFVTIKKGRRAHRKHPQGQKVISTIDRSQLKK